MRALKILTHGRITVPKKFREALGLGKGDVMEVEMKDGSMVLKPKKRTKAEALQGLKKVMDRVHAKNKDLTEEEVTRKVSIATGAELLGIPTTDRRVGVCVTRAGLTF